MNQPDTSKPMVLKFGGTSVGSPERILNVARIVQKHREVFDKVVVVVSAMGDTTDDLIALAEKVSPKAATPAHKREMDMLLTSGERISMALLSIALGDLGVPAISLTGSQTGILTDTIHGEARIHEIRPTRLPEIFAQKKVAIVAGFQGISADKEITTLGRGGSDTSAVALACVLNASEARIFTDVDGVFSADPRKVPSATLMPHVSWETVIEAGYSGAQVLHPRCVELSRAHGIPIRVINSFQNPDRMNCIEPTGTLVFGENMTTLEGPKVKIVSHLDDQVWVERSIASSRDLPEALSQIREKGLKLNFFEFFDGKLSGLMAKSDFDNAGATLKLHTPAEPFTVISLLGVGLSSDFALLERLQKVFETRKIAMAGMRVQPQSIAIWFNANKSDIAPLLGDIHDSARR